MNVFLLLAYSNSKELAKTLESGRSGLKSLYYVLVVVTPWANNF